MEQEYDYMMVQYVKSERKQAANKYFTTCSCNLRLYKKGIFKGDFSIKYYESPLNHIVDKI